MSHPIDILLVDDEARSLDGLEAILEDPAYRLLRAQDADTALRLLLEHDVAAIVMDMKMPGVSGIELATMIKNTRRFRQTPIVFLSAYMLEDQHVVAGYGAGAVDYLTKPVNPQVLRHKVAVFADLYRKTRELAELNDKLEDRVRERTAELARSEAALRESAAQKDEFLAVLAHELRNPLAPLRTGLDLLLRRLEGTPTVDRTLAVMNRQLDYMVRLIDDLLDVSRLSRGLLELKRETVDLGPVLESAVDGARAFFDRRQQRLVVEVASGVHAHVDPTRVAQIVTNLLHNASKFTPEGGMVRVGLGLQGGTAVASVSDSGPGVAQADRERIFEMFSRVNRPGARSESGLGIGLALARRLAQMHGGTLVAESEGEGRGTTFVLSLPAVSVSERRPVEMGVAPDRAAAAGGLDIVVIEDNPDVSDILVDWLQEMGHRVSLASSGESGISLIEQAKPQIVLCDLGLPTMGGIEVCRSVNALGLRERPVMVALTGWGREEDRQRTREAGFDHHIVKPVSPQKLLEVLHGTGTESAPAPPRPTGAAS
jgi:signal transduction histidine kinase